MYATNSMLRGWWEHITVIIWGAPAKLFAENDINRERIRLAQQAGVFFTACIACADQFGVTDTAPDGGARGTAYIVRVNMKNRRGRLGPRRWFVRPAEARGADRLLADKIWYIDGSGRAVSVPSGRYDAATGTVTFVTTHFSSYAVGYNPVTFTDVSGWVAGDIGYLASRGVMTGTGGGTFSPDRAVTRAEFVTILFNLSGAKPTGTGESAFSDVKSGDWFFDAVQWANAAGMTKGFDGRFSPSAVLTRQDLAVMLVRYAEKTGVTLPGTATITDFADSDAIAGYAADAVRALQRAGIITGLGDGSFGPALDATRAEAAKIVAGFVRTAL